MYGPDRGGRPRRGDHLIKMLTFLDTQGWLYSGHKLEAAAEIHRSKTLPSGPEIDV